MSNNISQSLIPTQSNGELSTPLTLCALLSRPIEWLAGDAQALPEEVRLARVAGVRTRVVCRRALVWHAKGYRAMAPFLLDTRATLVMEPAMRAALDLARFAIDAADVQHTLAMLECTDLRHIERPRESMRHDMLQQEVRDVFMRMPAVKARIEAKRYLKAMELAMKMVIDFWTEVRSRALHTLAEDKRQAFLDRFETAKRELATHWPAQGEDWQLQSVSLQDAGPRGPSDSGLLWTSSYDVSRRNAASRSAANIDDDDAFIGDLDVLYTSSNLSAEPSWGMRRFLTAELTSDLGEGTTMGLPPNARSELTEVYHDTVDGDGRLYVRVVATREFDAVFGHLFDGDGSGGGNSGNDKDCFAGTPEQWLFIEQSLQRARVVLRLCETVLDDLRTVSRDMHSRMSLF